MALATYYTEYIREWSHGHPCREQTWPVWPLAAVAGMRRRLWFTHRQGVFCAAGAGWDQRPRATAAMLFTGTLERLALGQTLPDFAPMVLSTWDAARCSEGVDFSYCLSDPQFDLRPNVRKDWQVPPIMPYAPALEPVQNHMAALNSYDQRRCHMEIVPAYTLRNWTDAVHLGSTTNFEEVIEEVDIVRSRPANKNVCGWIGNGATHRSRRTLVNLSRAHPDVLEAFDTHSGGGSMDGGGTQTNP